MPTPRKKNLDSPDEVLRFPRASASNVRLGDIVVGKLIQEPGWRWSVEVKPIAGTESCQFHHIGYALSGVEMVRMDDGTEMRIEAGDVYEIPPGHDSWVISDEPAISIIWSGWRGWGKPPVGDRVLTTIVITDISGSTDVAARVGDAAWDKVLERHDRRVREVLERYRGTEIGTTGDGFVAMFDGAARAVVAAAAIRDAAHDLDLQVRAGIHTGEVEIVPGNIRGIAVHETARILALASPDEILVSSTTHELASGSGLEFEDRGTHRLKGIPVERHVFALAGDRAQSGG